LFSSENLTVIEIAAETLCRIATSPEGTQAAVDTNVVECVAELLSSPNVLVQRWMCHILVELARNETTSRAAVGQLVSLLQ
jgi:hypothetical protein